MRRDSFLFSLIVAGTACASNPLWLKPQAKSLASSPRWASNPIVPFLVKLIRWAGATQRLTQTPIQPLP